MQSRPEYSRLGCRFETVSAESDTLEKPSSMMEY
jgi:hypothetical protein